METSKPLNKSQFISAIILLLIGCTVVPCLSGSYFKMDDPDPTNATVIPLPGPTAAWKDSTIVFEPKPWPPKASNLLIDTNLTLDFFYLVDNNTRNSLCKALYVNRTFVSPSESNGMVQCSNSSEGLLMDYRPVRDNVTFIMQFPHPQYSDQGRYGLELSVNGKVDATAFIEFIVYVWPEYPIIDSVPKGVPEGSEFNMTCHVKGAHPAADLTWSVNGAEQKPVFYLKTEHMTNSTITIKATKRLHGKIVQCNAWNVVNINEPVSDTATLSVLSAPNALLKECADTNGVLPVLRHTSMTLQCVETSLPSNDSVINWFRKKNSADEFVPLTITGGTYTVQNVTDDYRNSTLACSVTNKMGTSNMSSCRIDVQYQAVITLPKQILANENDTLTIQCEAEANPDVVKYEWWWNSVPKVYSKTLFFERLKAEEAGNYTCKAINVISLATKQLFTSHSTVEIIVEGKPTWDKSFLNKIAVREGKDLQITCAVGSCSKPNFQWKFSGLTLNESDRIRMRQEEGRSILTIVKATSADIGDYTCIANSSAGLSKFIISALKPGSPDPLISCYVHNETTSGITMVCSHGYDGGEPLSVETFLVQSGQEKELSNTVSAYSEGKDNGGRLIVVSVTGLPSGTDVKLNIYAKNKNGRSNVGLNMYAKTKLDHSIDETAGHGGENPAAIIGGIVGGVVCIALFSSLAVWAYVRYQSKKSADDILPIVSHEVAMASEEELHHMGRGRLSIQYSDDIVPETIDYDANEINQQSNASDDTSRSLVGNSSAKCHRASCPHHPRNIKRYQGPDDDIVEECQCDDISVEFHNTKRQDDSRRYHSSMNGNILSQNPVNKDGSGLGARPKEIRRNGIVRDADVDEPVNNGHSRNAITIESRGGDKTVGVIELHIPPPPPPPGKINKPPTKAVLTPLISFEAEKSNMFDDMLSHPLQNGISGY